jgi:hypothetical protein
VIAEHGDGVALRSVWSALYQGKVNLWVEDMFTEEPLRQLWLDGDISLLAAGGTAAVSHLTFQATPAGHKARVFAVVDLQSNNWLSTFPGKELLTQARIAIGLRGKDDNNQDVALRLTEAMKKQPERIPEPIKKLHKVLRQRSGLAPRALG